MQAWLQKLKNWFVKNPNAAVMNFFNDSANWYDVTTSTNVAGIAYYIDVRKGASSGKLGVRFLSRTWYYYDNVDVSTWTSFIAAPSRGKYLDRVIKKGGYVYHGPFSW